MSAPSEKHEQEQKSGLKRRERSQGTQEIRKEETEKYKQLYLMAEAAFKDEDNRYNRIEDTAHKYVPVMLFLVGAESWLAKWVLDSLIPPTGWLDLLGIAVMALAVVTLVSGILLLFRSFRYQDVRLFRPDREDVAFFDRHDLPTIYRAYAERFNLEREINTLITDRKARFRHRTYVMMLASSVCLGLTGLTYAVRSCALKSAAPGGSWIFFWLP